MNDVSRRRLPRNFVRRSLCDCFSQGNQKLTLVGKPSTPSERQARRRAPVSVESAHALLPSIRVHCLQGMARLNRIEFHSGDHKVASSERTAKVRYKPFVVNELSIASSVRELTGATPALQQCGERKKNKWGADGNGLIRAVAVRVLCQPSGAERPRNRRRTGDLLEYVCNENEKDRTHLGK